MKKIFLVALAAIGMTACMQDEVVEIANGGAIAFDNAFVGNATRAESVTTANLDAFKVWGYVGNPSGVVFNGTLVEEENGLWTYDETQYWMPNNAYWFAAVAPVLDEGAAASWELTMENAQAPRTLVLTTDGKTDLVYAHKEVEAADMYGQVAFQFEHLLSKVKLSFTQNLPEYNVAYIENLVVETVKTATIDLNDKVWTLGAETLSLVNAELTTYETEDYFIVPAECNVSFDVVVEISGVEVYKQRKTATIPADSFVMGHAYNLCADINPNTLALNEIEFSANVTDWVPAGNTSDAAANLLYAAQIGGVVTLEKDVILDAPVVVPAGVDFVLNLNGKTIQNSTQSEEFGKGEGIIAYGNLTINGEGTVEGTTMAVWARGNDGAKVTINGGTYKGCAEGFAKGGRSVIYASSGNTIDIYGGTFEALAADKTSYANKTEGVYAAVNIADNNGNINVYGGTFVNQNPAAPGTEPKAWNEAHPNGFVAEGYISVLGENGYTVVKGASVTSVDEFNAALTNPENEVVVVDTDLDYGTNGLSFERDVVVNFNNNDLVAGGKTTKNESFSVYGEYDVEVKNANITGGSIMAYFGADVVLDNVSLTYNYNQSGRNMIYAASDNDKQVVVTVNGGNYTMTGGKGNRYVCAAGNAIVYINGGVFTGKGAYASNAPIMASTIGNYTAQVIISGGTFDFDPSKDYKATGNKVEPCQATIADGYKVVKDGSYWTVVAE